MADELVQILATCPDCRVEAAVIELVELRAGSSHVLEGRCRMCGRHEEAGVLRQPGQRFLQVEQVRIALRRWADEEGEHDLHGFVSGGFGGLDEDALAAALLAGQPVETSFDVIAWLFPGLGGGGGSVRPDEVAQALEAGPRLGGGVLARSPAASSEAPSPPAPVASSSTRRQARARIAVKALIAVMLADGRVRPGERRFIDAFAAKLGLPPLKDEELRPYRPGELERPDDPGAVLRAMIDLTFVDRERDGSEWRVVREFARAWAWPVADLELLGEQRAEETSTAMARLWRSLRRLLLTEG